MELRFCMDLLEMFYFLSRFSYDNVTRHLENNYLKFHKNSLDTLKCISIFLNMSYWEYLHSTLDACLQGNIGVKFWNEICHAGMFSWRRSIWYITCLSTPIINETIIKTKPYTIISILCYWRKWSETFCGRCIHGNINQVWFAFKVFNLKFLPNMALNILV